LSGSGIGVYDGQTLESREVVQLSVGSSEAHGWPVDAREMAGGSVVQWRGDGCPVGSGSPVEG
jgi:hypothetical protein